MQLALILPRKFEVCTIGLQQIQILGRMFEGVKRYSESSVFRNYETITFIKV